MLTAQFPEWIHEKQDTIFAMNAQKNSNSRTSMVWSPKVLDNLDTAVGYAIAHQPERPS